MRRAKPIMAARPLSIPASGEKMANFSFLTPLKIGMREAAANMTKANRMDGSASPTCWKMDSPEAASAPRAEMKPSMAKRPLMVSGPAPEETDFFTGAGGGGGGGGVAAELEASVVGGSSEARTTTRLARLTLAASTLLGRALVKFFIPVAVFIFFVVLVVVFSLNFGARATASTFF